MDYYGLIAFCVGLGWIPIAIVAGIIYWIIEKVKEYVNSKD